MAEAVPCPFTLANGRKCPGHITRVEAYNCDVTWTRHADGKWRPSLTEVRSHYHLFCSHEDGHAATSRADNSGMKFYRRDLPATLDLTGIGEPP
jgi:hypothetical protein